MDVLKALFADPNLVYVGYLILANVVLAVVGSFVVGDFRLSKVGDWLIKRLPLLVVGYGMASLLAQANPALGYVKDAAFVTLTAGLVGFILSSLKEFGIPLPDVIAGRADG